MDRRRFLVALGMLPLVGSALLGEAGGPLSFLEDTMSRAACKEVICAAKMRGQLDALDRLMDFREVRVLTGAQVERVNSVLDDASEVIDQVFEEILGE